METIKYGRYTLPYACDTKLMLQDAIDPGAALMLQSISSLKKPSQV